MEEFIRIKYHRSLFKTEFLRFNLNAVLNLKIAKSNSKKNKKKQKTSVIANRNDRYYVKFRVVKKRSMADTWIL